MADWHLNSHRRNTYDFGQSTIAIAKLEPMGIRSTNERLVGVQAALGTAGSTDTTVILRRFRAGVTTVLATLTLGSGVTLVTSTINQKDGTELQQGDVIEADVTATGTSATDLGVTMVTHTTRR